MSRKSLVLNSVLGAGVIAVAAGGWFVLHDTGSSATTTRTTATVRRGTVSTSVSATGNLAAKTQMDVSFDSAVSSNTVTAIFVKVGDKVTKAKPLAQVDPTTAQAAVDAAQASYDAAVAAYQKLQTGPTEAERAQNQASLQQSAAQVRSAQTSLDNARATAAQNAIGYDNAVSQAETALANARTQADHDLATAQTSVDQAQANWDTAKANWDTAKAARDADKAAYDAAAADVAKYQAAKDYCTANPGTITAPDGTPCAQAASLLTQAQATLAAKNTALNGPNGSQAAFDKADATLTAATNSLTNAQNSFANTQLKSKQSIDSASNQLTNARNSRDSGLLRDSQSIASAQRQLESAQLSYNSAVAANAVKEAPPTEAQLAQANTQVVTTRNSLATAQKNLAATTLTAPLEGNVAVINGKVGFAANSTSSASTGAAAASGGSGGSGSSSSSPFMTLTDVSAYEVKAGFSEADALKVKTGQTAYVTFDALTGTRLQGVVSRVDGTATTVSNVVTYYAYITLDNIPPGTELRPGMTASVSVVVEQSPNVLLLQSSAVSSRGTTATVAVETVKGDPTKTEDRPVTLGLRGDEGVEIRSGLSEGDVVVITRTAISAAGAGATAGGGTLTGGQGGLPGGGGVVGGGGGQNRTGGGGGRGG